MRPDVHMLAGAYALDALPEAERDSFEKHLAACASCRAEVAGFTTTAARLGAAVAEDPPRYLRESVLRAAARTRQEAPAVRRGTEPRSLQHPSAWLAIAAALLLALTMGGLIAERQRAEELLAQQREISAILSAPDADATGARLGAGRLTVVASPQLDRAVLSVRNLPRLDESRVYQLWWVAGDQPRSAGLLELEQTLDGTTLVLDDLADAQLLAVTVEPAGGSQKPTPPIVATAELT